MDIDPKIQELVGDCEFDSVKIADKYSQERDKRLRPDHNGQYIKVTADFSNYADDPFVEPGFEREAISDDVEVVIVGGGYGGLLCGARLREVGFERIRIIEKAGDFGGTWYWNRYPGLRCDTESYVYLPLLEEMSYMPTEKYVKGIEIREHCHRIAQHYRLYEGACLQTKVTGLQWQEQGSRWLVSTDRGDTIQAQYVLMANGPMDRPKLPGIQGINEFRGHTFHTSRWDYAYTGGDEHNYQLTNLEDKRVGIVGTAATGLQCIPHLARFAQHLYVFQRTPAAPDVRANQTTDPEWVKSLKPGWQRERMDNFNHVVTGIPQEIDMVNDGFTEVGRLLDPGANWAAAIIGRELTAEESDYITTTLDDKKMEQIRARIDSVVQDKQVAEQLKPWHRRWCKRPLFSDDYLYVFNQANVTLVDTDGRGINHFTENSAVVNDEHYELDCLIFATGYEVGNAYTARTGYDIVGRKRLKLSEYWSNGMRTFNGLHINGFPNCMYIGFGQNATATNFCFILDEQAKHAAYVLSEARKRGVSTVEPTEQAVEEYLAEVSPMSFSQMKFWLECTPSYMNDEGEKGNKNGFFANIHPAGTVGFYDKLQRWREQGELQGLELDGSEVAKE